MRINETFAASRKSETEKFKPKYFIASEGSNSEPLYFEGLNKSIITENITIINILRDYASINNSHPTFIIKMIKEFILNNTQGEITVLELKNKIANFIHENNYKIDIHAIHQNLIAIYKKDNCKIKKEDLDELFLNLFKSEIYQDLAQNFPVYYAAQDVTYVEDVDKLNIVIDRDKQNFKDYQYDEVVKFCKDNNVNLYVSNPTFEFWLMLHFPDVETEDKTKMYENRYVTSSKRYLEKRLYEICQYKKSKLNFKNFEPNIKEAIKREKHFAEDLDSLKNKLGSNVGVMITKMLEKD